MIRLLQLGFFVIFISSFSQIQKEDFSNIEEVNKFKIPDSLKEISFEDLENRFYQDSLGIHEVLYSKTYIKKGFDRKDSLEMAKGYYLLSIISKDSLLLSFLNKGIELSKKNPTKDKEYPAILYYNKGDFYFDNANYKEALNNYFISFNLTKDNNPLLAYNSKFNIGLLKSRIGKHKEALDIFKEFYDYVLSERSEYPKEYFHKLIPLLSLSDTYTKLSKLDTATTINKEGIKISLLNNDNDMYYYFVMNEGVNLFFKKQYNKSRDSLKKALPNLIKLEDQSNILFCRLYLGKSYFELGKKEKAILQFKEIDSLFRDFKDVFPEIRLGYKTLINYYKEKNDKENQLLYLDKLIIVDSILSSNYKYINDRIIKDFETKNLVIEKEKIISNLNQSNSLKSTSIISLVAILIILSLVLIFNYRKRKNYKRKFEQLINPKGTNEKDPKLENEKPSLTYLSEDILNTIKKGLQQFKYNKEYLNKNTSISNLAKSIDTNSKYLSVFINQYEQKKFTDYINDLRIEYTIEKLKSDKMFRKYTIKAIAETVGFSNPVSFSQAFYKKTSIKPSYFIKKLESSVK
ncbi:hypothetical protein AWE51_08710 [Aquimarina aggregata]|uniref:HTH araC/xylS-type domain-containing protein n=1 Tax=Aquimarina aggregata TaxID=1642818 RepID=A0A162ZD92_9FLAO|nr:AraC family transcriptional regulator [Aquimarina aggregata]KZS39722.1 hypothetical protein AWE51_08710 [Aquimarina aggregata]